MGPQGGAGVLLTDDKRSKQIIDNNRTRLINKPQFEVRVRMCDRKVSAGTEVERLQVLMSEGFILSRPEPGPQEFWIQAAPASIRVQFHGGSWEKSPLNTVPVQI